MDISASGLHDRLGSFSKGDLFPKREEPLPFHSADGYDSQGVPLVQRCLIVRRDEKGYGLTVSGDNPVFVQSVKPDGAAARAGVHQGDRIIKVNGTLVTQSNHQDVVQLIKSGAHVALTLLGPPLVDRGGGANHAAPPTPSHTPSGHHNVTPKAHSERITGPKPVDPEKQQECTNISYLTIKKMLEQEQAYLEQMMMDYNKTSSEKNQAEMQNAKKRIASLEKQLHSRKGSHNEYSQHFPALNLGYPHPHHQRGSGLPSPSGRRGTEGSEGLRSLSFHVSSGQPKAQPVHHQVSAPQLGKGDWAHHGHGRRSVPGKGRPLGRSTEARSQLGSSASLENLSRALIGNPGSTQGVVPTHSRQRSSPDTLLYTMEPMDYPAEEEPPLTPCQDVGMGLFVTHSSSPEFVPPKEGLFGQEDGTEGTPMLAALGWNIEDPAEDTEDANTSEEAPPELAEPLQEACLEASSPMEGRPLPPIPADAPLGTLTGSSQQYGTPPESQPPMSRVPIQQISIISMDDDERTSDSEMSHLGDNGPFNNIWKLLRHPAHLAVFLNYLLSNQNDPSSLLFLIITNLYKLGTGKEMKKWAYEITSTFLVQRAPLSIANIDDVILKEIDQVLQNSQDHDEDLKDVFLKAREKAMEQLKKLLMDYRNTRTIRMLPTDIPSDAELDMSMKDKNAELKIVESLLVTELETLAKDDPDSLSDYKSALASALATVLRSFGVKTPSSVALIERFPTFVAKEKSRLKFFPRNKKFAFQTINTKGHHFQSQQYHCVTYCNHCQLIIWGVGDQGYQCSNCEMNIHKTCVKVVEEQCIGSLRNKKAKKNHRMSGLGLMENIKGKAGRRPQGGSQGSRRPAEEWSLDSGISMHTDRADSDKYLARVERDHGDDFDHQSAMHHLNHDAAERGLHSKKGGSIGRSESFRQRRETRPSYRKRSDPNIPRSKSDVDVDDKPNNLNNSGSSSNSSLSARSLESPSQSCEAVHRGQPAGGGDGGGPPAPLDDSDLECDTEPPKWQDRVPLDERRLLKPKEMKRQDVINELFHTERTHVRNLKILMRLFHQPLRLQQEPVLGVELLDLLFPNLEELLEIHQSFNEKMKRRRRQEPLVGDIGKMMLDMLDGESGENLKRAVATFCKNQSIALESLKSKQKKDQKLAQFLAEREMDPLCRRLQLKDMVATVFQRLTKYPLLLENVAKHTAAASEEHARLMRALECSKRILAHVNQAVREAENQHRLAELQRRLDKSAFDKVEHPVSQAFKNLDLRQHRLLYEGPLVWRLPRQKAIEVQLLLLEDMLVLLQRQDERLLLRFHAVHLPTAREDAKLTHCPVLTLQNVFTRDVATDCKAFFLVSTAEQHAMYEFAAASAKEKMNWLHHINEALRPHNRQQSQQKRSERMGSTEEPPVDSTLEDKIIAVHPIDSQKTTPESAPQEDHAEEEVSASTAAPHEEEAAAKEPPAETAQPDMNAEEPSRDGGEPPVPVAGPARIEASQVAQGLSLVDFQEVVVRPSAPFETAEPVLTPVERLRRKDQEILTALADKQDLMAEILRIPKDDFENIAEISEEMNSEKGVMELLLQITYHANRLPKLVNEAMNIREEDRVAAASVEVVADDCPAAPSPKLVRRAVPPSVTTDKLLSVATPLIRYLSLLAPCISELEQERQQLRQELSRLREVGAQQQLLLGSLPLPPSASGEGSSRPCSFVSVASSENPDWEQLGPVEDLDTAEAPTTPVPTETTVSTALVAEPVLERGPTPEPMREACVQTCEEQLCCCPTTDLDEEEEPEHSEAAPARDDRPPPEEEAEASDASVPNAVYF
ncbi:rho guanine nucleotide exchange factor 11 isoform X6 [Ixodes scapularis]|uniref:rho guanine nucleotide exchange factor 11 isoform X6 n=1 Tax=Ixodes scapularis TaxID=6945 RepID=UPI001C393587|nr:rho guanine nucleotide exchange factor 11 isoform X6 [Ixodes scapularis]